jgi:hypothetical protein
MTLFPSGSQAVNMRRCLSVHSTGCPRDCSCSCHTPPPRQPADLIRGVTMWARTVDGRRVMFRQPLVDPSRKAAGTWDGDGGLIDAVQLFLHGDPDESPDNLHSVALALLYAAGEGGTNDPMSLVLAYHHPREELERQAREREWRDRLGWDDPPEVRV